MKKAVSFAAAAVALLAVIQVIPYGKRSNPPVVREPRWDAETRRIARKGCFDCHSFETNWPWYAKIAPVSWMLAYNVEEGREELNFSDWRNGTRRHENVADILETLREKEMPPALYLAAHPEARLSDGETEALVLGLARSIPARRQEKGRH